MVSSTSPNCSLAAIVLAAGAGTRMKSAKPKVAHEILGRPLVRWVIKAAQSAGVSTIVSVVGSGREEVIPLVEGDTAVAVQAEQRGTADAVAAGLGALGDFHGSIMVLSGDCPCIQAETLTALANAHLQENAAVSLLTMQLENPFGYGRIVRNGAGKVEGIVEQKDATPEQAALTECNAGFYCFEADFLRAALGSINNDNAQGEFYLTDVVALAAQQGLPVVALCVDDTNDCLGVNSRQQLAEATAVLQTRINAAHMAAGVTLWSPATTWIGPDVKLAPDVEVLPNVILLGNTSVAMDCVIGPNTRLSDCTVGRACVLDETIAASATLDDGAHTGPRAYIRPGTHVCAGAKVGTHVEIKNSVVGEGSKVPHLSYIGDTTIGRDVNVGAGSITCNYDGHAKHKTVIGDGAFIGSDTMMVAPVEIGAGAVIAAGSCITENVSPEALGIARARQSEIEGWALKYKD